MKFYSIKAGAEKLTRTAYDSLDQAWLLCSNRSHESVTLAHWLWQWISVPNSDVSLILRHFELDVEVISKALVKHFEKLVAHQVSRISINADVEDALERGWVTASLVFGRGGIRTVDLLLGCYSLGALKNPLIALSSEFQRIDHAALLNNVDTILKASIENTAAESTSQAAARGPATAGEPGVSAGQGKGQGKERALDRFTTDLIAQARGQATVHGRPARAMDPIVGRDAEIRQIIDILLRRKQNNPMLVGEAGVGKTAVVEGFAQRIARGDVPPSLRSVELRALDVGLLQAGASLQGEFEQRLRAVIDEVQASVVPVILFIDETHTLVGAGGKEGTGDAANLLKPALARGDLRTIGATTFAEYKKHIEKDPALTRRFQAVQVDEPSEEKALKMMRGIAGALERHHGVYVLDDAIRAAVRLSRRYIPARQLPDKSVSLLDTACARVAVSQHATPPAVDDCERDIQSLQVERAILRRDAAIGVAQPDRLTEVDVQISAATGLLERLREQWQAEKALVSEILALRRQLSKGGPGGADVESPDESDAAGSGSAIAGSADDDSPANDPEVLKATLETAHRRLATIQGEQPMLLPGVDEQVVAQVVADWTSIPVGRMAADEIDRVLRLADLLGERVIGQRQAMEVIARRIETSRAGLDNPQKPVGVFLLAGTSGVGKTETAAALAEMLYGGEQNLVTINMSEFQEPHSVSTLKGAPPGYVGYGEGGVLTEAVRRKPYSVVLLDEVEKAHRDVHEIFFQVFDKGYMEDGEGRLIDFKNTLILLTTNAGSEVIARLAAGGVSTADFEGLAAAIRPSLLEVFPPAFLGRLVTVPYFPLSDEVLGRIVQLQLDRIRARVAGRYRVRCDMSASLVDHVVSRCTESESGGRMIDSILSNSLLPQLSREFLQRSLDGRTTAAVSIDVQDGRFVYDFH